MKENVTERDIAKIRRIKPGQRRKSAGRPGKKVLAINEEKCSKKGAIL